MKGNVLCNNNKDNKIKIERLIKYNMIFLSFYRSIYYRYILYLMYNIHI